jgi:hypothetical protein
MATCLTTAYDCSFYIISHPHRHAKTNRSSLAFANLIRTHLYKTSFHFSDLSYSNLSHSCCQFQCNSQYHCYEKYCDKWNIGILSKQNIVLCNGTVDRQEKPVYHNGPIDCNGFVVDGWSLAAEHTLTIIQLRLTNDSNNTMCALILSSFSYTTILNADVNISHFETFFENDHAAVVVRARMSEGVIARINVDDQLQL